MHLLEEFLILNTSSKSYYDNMTVTSFINIKSSSIAVENIPYRVAFYYLFSAAVYFLILSDQKHLTEFGQYAEK